MTPKERVMTSLSWTEPDRVPTQIYLTPEIEKKLTDYLGGKNPLEVLEIDMRSIWPLYKGKVKESHDGIHYDEWGTGIKYIQYSSAGSYPEAAVQPLAKLKTLDDVENYPWPKVEDYDFDSLRDVCDKNKDYCIVFGHAGIPDINNGVSFGRGMEQVMMDIALRDPVGMAIIDKRVDLYYEYVKRTLETIGDKVDILHLGEDTGNQNGRMFSAKDFEEVFRPRIEKFIKLGHKFGLKTMMHSCGDTHEIMDTFIDMGLDILDAMQPEPAGMDPETIREKCKGKLAFCGLISTQQTLPHGTIEDCRKEARHRIDVIAKGGGYIFSPAHCIQPDTPVENILAIYEEALGKKLIKD